MTFTFPYRKWPQLINRCRWIVLILACAISHASLAHDIPSNVTVHAYIKPEGDQLQLLVRVPMEAFSEIDFPKRGPGYLDFDQLDSVLANVAYSYLTEYVKLYEAGQELGKPKLQAVRVTLPADKSFTTYASAVENFSRPLLTNATELYWNQGLMDAWLTYSIQSDQSKFSMQSNLDRLGMQTNTDLRFVLPSGGERLFNYIGNPGRVELDPSLFQSIWRFIVLGFEHILDGIDHLLFLFCLIIPIRSVRALIPVISAFTVAHSITLISSAFGMVPNVLWFAPLIETLIAVSIVYMAFENILSLNKLGGDFRYRWLVTFGFGLVHGFGFSFVLAETMQFAGRHLLSALLAFNVGVEFGQMFVLIITVPLLGILFKLIRQEKVAVILLSALVAHTAWHWMLDRGEALLQYNLTWPVMDLAFFIGLVQWLMLLVIVVGVLWLLFGVFNRFHLLGPTKKETQG